MAIHYSKENLTPTEHRWQRAFEILPGATSWLILLGMIALSFSKPLWAAMLIIAFDLFWLFKLIYMTIFLLLSYFRLTTEEDTDWNEHIRHVDYLTDYLKTSTKPPSRLNLARYFSWKNHHLQLETLNTSGRLPPPSNEIYNTIIIPIAKESTEIVEPGIESLTKQSFPGKRILVVLAVEERAEQSVKKSMLDIQNKYRSTFLDVLVFVHPDKIAGEARVKGANVTYAARRTTDYLTEMKIPHENVILSCFDADTVVSPNFFSCLTYHFMVTPQRERSSFQPIPVYHNNIWDVPCFARVMEIGSSFFQLIEATNPEKLVTFSSHSMSLKALVEVDYWPVDMISDDSAIFWKCYIHFNGDYRVVPILTTLSMDVAGSKDWIETIRTVYKQKRRWAWGVENFPIVSRLFMQNKKISLNDKIRHGFKMFEGHISWATWGFLLSFIGWLPAIFARQEYMYSVVSYNAPRVISVIFNLAGLSLAISIFISISLLPRQDRKISFLENVQHALEWLLLPFILTFLSALPALDAQTRLMFGKYMEFWVTDKTRQK
ncbi:MAG: glycosyltransferase family 2 protein [Candidatus Omnitrophica bacterium]|nr:glycosyltransferase family 2 protein [Candidatus Omnitrophota bacterium]